MPSFYSDPRYGVSKSITFCDGLALGATAATALERRVTVMENITVTDLNVAITTGATAAVPAVTVGYSLDGTGAFTAFSTCALGTQADGTVLDCTVTETNVNSGSDIIFKKAAGTAAGHVLDNVQILYKEHFVA